MSKMQRLRERGETERVFSDEEVLAWLIDGSDDASPAAQEMMGALMPLLMILFVRRLCIERDDLEVVVRETVEHIRAEAGSHDARARLGKWLIDLARRTVLERLDRQARLATLDPDAETISATYRVLAPLPAASSPHPRFWE